MVIHLQPDIQIGSTLDQIIFTIYGMKYDMSALRDKGKVIDGADKGAQVLFVVVLREEEHDVRRVLLCESNLITCSFNSLRWSSIFRERHRHEQHFHSLKHVNRWRKSPGASSP